ncbi:Flp family type IVb pilin [uncultured Erythrobacter sp.]|uniref:Flp family type IVb pilin n=1 Tax=uncultured Erythrobacter sp. TaxID=263913 RepID=UPI00265AF28B|nr:Flp family type IVb pilin [uncultured Erythrobacter sp.]
MRATFFKRLQHDTAGATAVEYGLVVGLIAVAMVGALWEVANTASDMWNDIEARSTAAMTN